MNLGKISEDCAALESIIFALISENTCKHTQLNRLQDNVIESSRKNVDQLVDYESKLKDELDNLRLQKLSLDNDNRHLTSLNEKLNELVTIANSTSCLDDAVNNGIYLNIYETIQEYEKIRDKTYNIHRDLTDLLRSMNIEINGVDNLVSSNKALAVSLHKNQNSLRILAQQNKFSERQFDLILSQLPWEPMTDERIAELHQSDRADIRDLAVCLQLQTSEIKELNESLTQKKFRKLEILNRLASELKNFSAKRDEVTLLSRF